ncbi:hypothetical protein ACC703_13005 [Rhizobium ruizarguesonis]
MSGSDGRRARRGSCGTISAGWRPEEVAAALVELADNNMLSVLANQDFARDLADLKK